MHGGRRPAIWDWTPARESTWCVCLCGCGRRRAALICRVAVSYDEGETWQEQGGVTGSGRLRDCVLHVRPRRCRRLRLRIYGVGGCRVYSLTAVYEKGSDGP